MKYIAKQALAIYSIMKFYGFLGLELLEMAKFLPVVHEWFRK